MGKGSTMGLLYTGRVGDNYFNHVAGVDGFFRLSKTKTLNFQYLHSQTHYPETIAQLFGQEEKSFGGNALYTKFIHNGRNMYYSFLYEDLSTGFRADFGFIPRVDTRKIECVIGPVIWGKEGAWFDRIGFMVRGKNITDHDNIPTDREFMFAASYMGPLQSKFIYNFSVRSSVRANIQYTDISRNVGLYHDSVEPETKALFTQLLFSYKINPQTVLFIGYSDNHLGFKGIDITRTDRTFFLKIGYALVL